MGMVAKRGVVNLFGGLPKTDPYIKFDSNLTHYREFYVIGNHGSAPRHNQLAINLLASGKISAKDLVTHRFGIDETIEAIGVTERGEGLKTIVASTCD